MLFRSFRCLMKMNLNKVVSGDNDNTIKVFDIVNDKVVLSFNGHTDLVKCFIKISDNEIASGSLDETIKLWDTSNGKCFKTLNGHDDWIMCLVRLNEKQIASGSRDKTIKIWDIKDGSCLKSLLNNLKNLNLNEGKCLITFTGHDGPITCLIKLNEYQIVSGSYDLSINIWNLF